MDFTAGVLAVMTLQLCEEELLFVFEMFRATCRSTLLQCYTYLLQDACLIQEKYCVAVFSTKFGNHFPAVKILFHEIQPATPLLYVPIARSLITAIHGNRPTEYGFYGKYSIVDIMHAPKHTSFEQGHYMCSTHNVCAVRK